MNFFLKTVRPVMNDRLIAQKVETVRKNSAMVDLPADMEEIARNLGYNVRYSLFKGTLSPECAACVFPKDRSLFINKTVDERDRSYVIAHQLGLVLLFPDFTLSGDYTCLMRRRLYGPYDTEEETGAGVFARLLLGRDNLALLAKTSPFNFFI